MEKCLVTKLKATVLDNTMLRIGELVLYFKENNPTSQTMRLAAVSGKTISVRTDYPVKLNGGSEEVTSFEVGNADVSILPATTHKTTLFVGSYYGDFAQIVCPGQEDIEFDIMKLQWSTSAIVFRFLKSKIYGDVYELFDALANNGKTSGTLTWSFNPEYCKNALTTDNNKVTFTTDRATHPRGWYIP